VTGIFIQLDKYVTWLASGLPFDFNTPLKGIKILGVPLGISSFTSSFIKNAMSKDVRHVDLFSRMGDVQVAFGILTHYFM